MSQQPPHSPGASPRGATSTAMGRMGQAGMQHQHPSVPPDNMGQTYIMVLRL